MKTQLKQVPLLVLVAGLPFSAQADWTDNVTITGFGSAVYQRTDEESPFNGHADEAGVTEDGSFRSTRFGLNINATVGDRADLAMQLIASNEEDSYSAHIDWGFIGFNINPNFTLRAGKIKFPVGVVNEYVDVGYAYPWITPPVAIYTELGDGPQATREAYTGISALFSKSAGDWTLGADLFGGEVNLEQMDVKELVGITVRADWNDLVQFQASTYQGTMRNAPVSQMEGKYHKATLFGVRTEWKNWIAYAETADVEMEDLPARKADSWYITIGHRFGKYLPHFTYQSFEQGDGDEHEISTVGLRYELMRNTALKFEVSNIDTTGQGLFENPPSDSSTRLFAIAVDFVF